MNAFGLAAILGIGLGVAVTVASKKSNGLTIAGTAIVGGLAGYKIYNSEYSENNDNVFAAAGGGFLATRAFGTMLNESDLGTKLPEEHHITNDDDDYLGISYFRNEERIREFL